MRAKAKVREHRPRPAKRQVRQAKGKRKNRYVIKVMKLKLNREGGKGMGSLGSREVYKLCNWSIIIIIYYLFYNIYIYLFYSIMNVQV